MADPPTVVTIAIASCLTCRGTHVLISQNDEVIVRHTIPAGDALIAHIRNTVNGGENGLKVDCV